MTIKRFEDFAVWQRAKALSVVVYGVTNEGAFARDFGLRDQIRRAAVSIMSNIAEGFERYSRTEFRHFLSIARGSAAEVRSQLHLARDLGYLEEADFRFLYDEAMEISLMLGSLRSKVNGR